MSTFADLGISPDLESTIDKLGFKVPTEIQIQAIPILLEGNTDLVGLAQTGTGKTAAFGLPLIEMVDSKSKVTQALIIAPTRELCMQITKELKNFSSHIRRLGIVPVYGGADIRRQIKLVKDGAQIIVATPGRLKDLIKRKVVNLREVEYVVLDEADEMLNMGFQEDIDSILETTPEEKHVWLFSATMPREVARIAKNYMRKPKEISAGDRNIANKDIAHQYLIVKKPDQYYAFKRLIDADPNIFGLVFCRTRRDTKELADKLSRDGYNADALHGDLNQGQRDRVMDKFRRHQLKFLVATDVAARGIDVSDITHVFNFNIPDDLAFYTHRSGRTGRAGKKGVSVVLLSPREKSKLRRLENMIQAKFILIGLPDTSVIFKNQVKGYLDKWAKVEIHPKAPELLEDLSKNLKEFSKDELIAKAVSLSFSKMLLAIDQQKESRSSERRSSERRSSERRGSEGRGFERRISNDRERPAKRTSTALETPQRMFINLGEMDFKSKRELIEMIAEYAGIGQQEVHDVKLSKRNSYFTIDSSIVKRVSSRFRNSSYKGLDLRVNPDGDSAGERSNGRSKGSRKSKFFEGKSKSGKRKGQFSKKKKSGKKDRKK